MAFPQIPASTSLLKGLPFFRIKELLASPGDLFESDESALAIGLGPESDIARVKAVYYDKTQPATNMSSLLISPDRPFASLLESNNNAPFGPTINPGDLENLRPGKILLYPDDIYDPSWAPRGVAEDDQVRFFQPVLDVVLYMQPPIALPSKRVDRVYTFPQGTLPNIAPENAYYVIPSYGRKYIHISAQGQLSEATTLGVMGINYQLATNAPGQPSDAFETTLFASAAISDVTATNIIVTAGNQGMFDAIVIVLPGTTIGEPTVRIVLSDTPASTPAAP